MRPTICVIGLGYIGLPTASLLATNGCDVLGVDVNHNVIDTINRGDVHIYEPGLRTLVNAAISSGNLKAATKPVKKDVYIICVPTPLDDQQHCDISYVRAAGDMIAPLLSKDNLVILESTSPPRTTEDILVPILEKSGLKTGEDVYVAYCPERVIPGKALKELTQNDRIIGGINEVSAQKAREVYEIFVEGEILFTDSVTAEMVKLMENTYRDVNIALANEFANVCERLGINSWEAIELANRHPRVTIHTPGPGVGGHCIAIDPWFIAEKCPELTTLITTARLVNDGRPQYVVDTVKKIFREQTIKPPQTVAVLGLSYKANIDDMRESPSLKIIELLQHEGIETRAYDPFVEDPEVPNVSSPEEAIKDADLILLCTDHKVFNEIVPEVCAPLMRHPIIYDLRGMIDPTVWTSAGFTVFTLGRR